eukprot:552761-Rhodomonas_salina.1
MDGMRGQDHPAFGEDKRYVTLHLDFPAVWMDSVLEDSVSALAFAVGSDSSRRGVDWILEPGWRERRSICTGYRIPNFLSWNMVQILCPGCRGMRCVLVLVGHSLLLVLKNTR